MKKFFHTYPPIKMEQSVSKRGHIKFGRRGITQKKACNEYQEIPRVLWDRTVHFMFT